MVDFGKITESVETGDGDKARQLTKAALDANVPAKEILDKGLVPGINKVGARFEAGEYFLPELLVGGEAMLAALELLEPILSRGGTHKVGRCLMGTVQGDLHNLGKDIVIMMLKANGWQVTDLGVDITPERFCSAVDEGNYDILGMSALLTMTMPSSAKTIEALKAAGLRDKVKIMVGGAPTTPEWAKSIGADGHAFDANGAVKMAVSLVGKS